MASARHEIRIELLAKTTVMPGLRRWLKDEFDHEPEIDELTDAEALVALAAKRCYRSFEPGLNPNVTRVRKDWTDYLDHILASGHGSVLEHASFTFGIEGVSRVFTAEMNRHRAGWSVSEQSLRYVRLDRLEWWLPEIFRADPGRDTDLVAKQKARTLEIMGEAFDDAERRIRELCAIWNVDDLSFAAKKRLTSAFRRIVPMGVSTGGVWTGNVRALRHVITLRSTPEAEEEIAHVFTRIGAAMAKNEPRLFGDFVPLAGEYLQPKYRKV